jgi:hypothetical protein
MTFTGFLTWLTTSGGSIVAASWLLGQIPGYDTLLEKTKQWIFFGVAAVLGGGAYAGITYLPANTVAAIAPYFMIVSLVFVAIFVNKAYTQAKNAAKAVEALTSKLGFVAMSTKFTEGYLSSLTVALKEKASKKKAE